MRATLVDGDLPAHRVAGRDDLFAGLEVPVERLRDPRSAAGDVPRSGR